MNSKHIISLSLLGSITALLLSGCFLKKEQEESALCSNTCQYAYDGECDDGGPGSSYSLCDCGTDCSDCGERSASDCGGSSSSSSSSGGGYSESMFDGYWYADNPVNGNQWQLYLCSNGLFAFIEYNPVGETQFYHTGNWSVTGSTLTLSGSGFSFQIVGSGSVSFTVVYSNTQAHFSLGALDPCETTGGSSSSSSSGGSSSSSSGGSSSSSGSSSSGGVSYMPTGTVHLVFNGNYRYSGTTSSKTGQVEAPWDPATSLIGYTSWACPPVGQNIGGSDITITNVVYYRYSLNRCGTNPVDHYENTFMPAYQGQTVTFYIGP